jgi:hypothetical protein
MYVQKVHLSFLTSSITLFFDLIAFNVQESTRK